MYYSTAEMSAVFSREAHIRAILRFETALASAEAQAGVIPHEAAATIAEGCRTFPINEDELFGEAIHAGTLAIPLVKALTRHVGDESGAYVHWGATSQDAIDSAFMLQMRIASATISRNLVRISDELARLADRHRATIMIGRTLTQQALPITFGLKAARWLSMFVRQLERMRQVESRAHVVQFGGAAGTLASLGSRGPRVREHLAEELDLGVSDLPWHTERDRVVEIASAVASVAGCAEKLAGDLLLMAQSEIGEISERTEAGKGGSSAMPHKRNPVDLVGASAAARLATETVAGFFTGMSQEHERSPGKWQSEWERIPSLFQYTDFALERLFGALEGLEVHTDRMQTNLELSNGLVMTESLAMALAERVGRIDAYRLVDAASKRALETGESVNAVCQDDREIREILSAEEIERALDPSFYLGSTDTFIDTALKSYRAVRAQSGAE